MVAMTAQLQSRGVRARLASSGPWTRAQLVAVLLIAVAIVAGGALRVTAIGGDARVSSDEHGNVADANSILIHGRYRTLRWAPGAPFLFAVATRLTGRRQMKIVTHSHQPAQYAQLIVELVTLVLAAVIAWFIAGPWAGLIAVALCAFYIPLIIVTRTYLTEPFGGLMILATFAAAAWARTRGWRGIAAAGAFAGLGCITREDLFPAVLVIAVAIAWPVWRSSHRRAALSALLYVACTILVVAPWVLYASERDGRFVPITDGGTDAFFVGSYLPGHGELSYVNKSIQVLICRRSAHECERSYHEPSAATFRYVASLRPGLSQEDAVRAADIENVKKYALGKPLAFTGMLANKLWGMWSYPWSGGNGAKHPDTSRPQHIIFAMLAWIGLLGGALVTRRWSLITVSAGLFVVTGLNILVNAQGRDNVRLVPLLYTFGAAGLVLLLGAARRRRGRGRSGAQASAVGSVGTSS